VLSAREFTEDNVRLILHHQRFHQAHGLQQNGEVLSVLWFHAVIAGEIRGLDGLVKVMLTQASATFSCPCIPQTTRLDCVHKGALVLQCLRVPSRVLNYVHAKRRISEADRSDLESLVLGALLSGQKMVCSLRRWLEKRDAEQEISDTTEEENDEDVDAASLPVTFSRSLSLASNSPRSTEPTHHCFSVLPTTMNSPESKSPRGSYGSSSGESSSTSQVNSPSMAGESSGQSSGSWNSSYPSSSQSYPSSSQSYHSSSQFYPSSSQCPSPQNWHPSPPESMPSSSTKPLHHKSAISLPNLVVRVAPTELSLHEKDCTGLSPQREPVATPDCMRKARRSSSHADSHTDHSSTASSSRCGSPRRRDIGSSPLAREGPLLSGHDFAHPIEDQRRSPALFHCHGPPIPKHPTLEKLLAPVCL